MKKKTAIVLGATGLCGSFVLKRLIEDGTYSNIKIFSRRSNIIKSPKIQEFIGDVIQLQKFRDHFTGHEVFCCVGTTSAKTKDRKVYRDIDYGIPVKAAQLARENKISTFQVISSMGANAQSKVFYTRTKGEMEQAVLEQGIPKTYILRPSLILGPRGESRITEGIAAVLMKAIKPILSGKARKYRAIEADCIAAAMINLAKSDHESGILESDVIQDYCQ